MTLLSLILPPMSRILCPIFFSAGSHVVILKGNLSPGGSVIKLSGKDLKHFRGPARVFDAEVSSNIYNKTPPSHR